MRQTKTVLSRMAASVLIAGAIGLPPTSVYAVPSVPATPAQDVYTILSNNPGLAASVPIYNQPQAKGTYNSLTVIGDSYADQGNALVYNPNSTQVGADGRYGNALNIIDGLEYHYGLTSASVTNYAFGGASSGSVNNNPPALNLPGFAQEVQSLVSSGTHFGPKDLITFTTAGVGGANDAAVGIGLSQGSANVAGYVQTLIGLGGSNFLFNTPSAAATASLESALQPLVRNGVNFYVYDFGDLVNNILANPTAYGFAANATSADYCTQFGGTHVCNAGGPNKASAQTTQQILTEDQYLTFYAHPTTALAGLIAAGDVNALNGPALPMPEPGSLGVLALGVLATLARTAAGRRWPS